LLERSVEGWRRNPKSFLTSAPGPVSFDSIYWRSVERQEQTEKATICQRFDDFAIYYIAVRTGYHTGSRWTTSGLSHFAKGIQNPPSYDKNHSADKIVENLDKRVSAGCFWAKWLAALAKIDKLDSEQDRPEIDKPDGKQDRRDVGKLDNLLSRLGYLILMPQGIITENQYVFQNATLPGFSDFVCRYTTKKTPKKIRDAAAQILVRLKIAEIAKDYKLLELGGKLLQVIWAVSLEASIQPSTQNPVDSQTRSILTPASNCKKRKLGRRVPPPSTSHRVTCSSLVVQGPFGSDSPASQATEQASCHTQQRTSTPLALTFGGQRSAEIQDASPPHEHVIAGKVASQGVSYSVNFTGKTVLNGDQNGGGKSCQRQGLGECLLKITRASLMDHAAQSSPPEGSQATEAFTSQLFRDLSNTERMGNFTTSPTSLSEAGAFFASNINSHGTQMLAAVPHYGAQGQGNDCYITTHLGDYGTQEHGSDHYITTHLGNYGTQEHGSDHCITARLGDYGTQEHGSDHYITTHLGCYGAQEQGSAPPFVAGMNSYGA
jgi:hypothetical protein